MARFFGRGSAALLLLATEFTCTGAFNISNAFKWGTPTAPAKKKDASQKQQPSKAQAGGKTKAGNADVVLENAPNVGNFGGSCTCPSGRVYQVGDYYNSCGSLACVGWTAGTCNKKTGNWSHRKVTCKAAANSASPMPTYQPFYPVTTRTTVTPWDSSAWSSGAGSLKSSARSGASLGSSAPWTAKLNQGSSTSDWSDSMTNFGSNASGSSGSFLQLWQWSVIFLCWCCCCVGLVVCCVQSLCGKKKKRRKSERRLKTAPTSSRALERKQAPEPVAEPEEEVLPAIPPLVPMVPTAPAGMMPPQTYARYGVAGYNPMAAPLSQPSFGGTVAPLPVQGMVIR